MRSLLEPADELLNKKASPVPIDRVSSAEIQNLIDNMFELANNEQGDEKRRTLVGLAAPQIGISKRIIIAGINATGMGEQPKLKAYINPEIIEHSNKLEDGREGCYSTGNVCGIVPRHTWVVVRALDREGHKIEEKHAGFVARVFQHEIDHLDGIRFPDKIDNNEHLHWVVASKFGQYRREWAEWPIKCPRERWEKMKKGGTA